MVSDARRPRNAPSSRSGHGSNRRRKTSGPRARRAPRRPFRARRVVFLLGFTVFCLIAGGLAYLAQVPLPNPHPQPQATLVYSAGGQTLASYESEDRTDVTLAQVPPVVIDAVTSTEDRHFFTEGAINPISTVRALVDDLFGNGGLQGGSTITQQYVKQAYLTPKRTLSRKVQEAFIAIKLEHTLSKDRILQDYLNTIYLGRGAYGIQAAAQAYFGMNASQLELPEASLLAGMIREPDTADPSTDPALAHANQDDTLRNMVEDRQITLAQANAVTRMPFSAYVLPNDDDSGTPVANVADDQYFLDAVHAELVDTYGANEVESGGLRVTTTLNPTMQDEAYNAVYGSGPNALNPQAGDPSGAMVTVADNGDVQALIGGQNYATSQVDLALGASGGGSGRQAGSTFKVFMLAYLLSQGYTVNSQLKAPAKLIVPHGNANGTPWVVGNDEGEAETSKVTITQATALSLNTVYAQIVERLGAKNLDSEAEAMGISSAQLKGAYPSQVLGSADVSPLEMAGAYDTFANQGVYHAPVLITRVTTASGKVLPLPPQTVRRVLTPTQAAVEDYVLQQVVQYGTAYPNAGDVGSEIAGKTGTTQNQDDAWFIGFTPHVTTAMWMGYANAEAPMVDFRGYAAVDGGTIPALIWHDAMKAYIASFPALRGTFPTVTSLPGQTLTPPTNVVIPTTTTTSTSTTTTSTSTTTTTTVPGGSTTTTTTTPKSPTTSAPPPTTTPPTTAKAH